MTTTAIGLGDAGPGQQAGGLDAVQPRHADVEQADIRAERSGHLHRLSAVGRLADDRDVGVGVEDHAQTGANDLLIVGHDDADDHADAPRSGRTAVTAQPPPARGPAVHVPPRPSARSIIPAIPKPTPSCAWARSPSSVTSTVSASSPARTRTSIRLARRAWRRALVIDSCTRR